MAYPTTGSSISFQEINTELGNAPSNQLSLGDAATQLGIPFTTDGSIPIRTEVFYEDVADNNEVVPFNLGVAQSDDIGEQLAVSWSVPGNVGFRIVEFVIYVRTDEGSFISYKTVTGNMVDFTTLAVSSNTRYRIRVQAKGVDKPDEAPIVGTITNVDSYPYEEVEIITEDLTPTS